MKWLLDIFTAIFNWCLSLFGKKFALASTVGVTFIAGWVALQTAVYLTWTGIGFALPDRIAAAMPYIMLFIPSKFVQCFTAYVTARMLIWLWHVQSDWLKMIMAAKA